MKKLFRIPVLGRVLRVFNAFAKAPERFDALFAEAEANRQQRDAISVRADALQRQIDQQWEQVNANAAQMEAQSGQIRVHSRLLEAQDARYEAGQAWNAAMTVRLDATDEHLRNNDARLDFADLRITQSQQRLDAAEARMATEDSRLNDHDAIIREVRNIEPPYLNLIVDRIRANREKLMDLNRDLSTNPVIWGPSDRLHIAPSAAVSSCLLNTNSGEITVGEYTFAGSRVSILAGSHDKQLQGFLRRDVEITEGCDIIIGDGVWLASNCTLLGPCTIGDNAVIAAGAVVLPGTIVPPDTIYGGIPAKQIGKLEFDKAMDETNPSFCKAFERSHGLMFVSGWSEKKICAGVEGFGHWMTDSHAVVCTDRQELRLRYALRGADTVTMQVETADGPTSYELSGEVGTWVVQLPKSGKAFETVDFRMENPEGQLFVSSFDGQTNVE